jgi:hypothetical protein
MPDTLTVSVLASPVRSSWATWLVSSDETAACETRTFLESGFTRLPSEARRAVAKRLRQADSANVDALLHELLVYEVCNRLGILAALEPKVGGQRPDLELRRGNQTYLADVFLTSRPLRTRREFGGLRGYRDAGEAAKKIADAICTKITKYRDFQLPLLVFVVFEGRDVGHRHVETALYGGTVDEIAANGGITLPCHEDWHPHGILCPPGISSPRQELSAVVGCDWFDTLSRARPGRRLHCVVYHHWQARRPLPDEMFGPIPEVRWRQNAGGLLAPVRRGIGNLVLETSSVPGVNFAPYSPNEAW